MCNGAVQYFTFLLYSQSVQYHQEPVRFFSVQYFLSAISQLQDNTSDSHVSPILPLSHLPTTGQQQWLTCQSNTSSLRSLNYRTTPVTHMSVQTSSLRSVNYRTTPVTHMSVQYFLPAISQLQDNTSDSHVSPILFLCDLSPTGQQQWLTCQVGSTQGPSAVCGRCGRPPARWTRVPSVPPRSCTTRRGTCWHQPAGSACNNIGGEWYKNMWLFNLIYNAR